MPIVINKLTGRPEYIEDAGGTPGALVGAGGMPGSYVGATQRVEGDLPPRPFTNFSRIEDSVKAPQNRINPGYQQQQRLGVTTDRDLVNDDMQSPVNRMGLVEPSKMQMPMSPEDRAQGEAFNWIADTRNPNAGAMNLGVKTKSPFVPIVTGDDGSPEKSFGDMQRFQMRSGDKSKLDFDDAFLTAEAPPVDEEYPAAMRSGITESDLPPMDYSQPSQPSQQSRSMPDDRQLMALFMKSAAQAGQIRGQRADAQPPQDYANALDKEELDMRKLERDRQQQQFDNQMKERTVGATENWRKSLVEQRSSNVKPMGATQAFALLKEIERINPEAARGLIESGAAEDLQNMSIADAAKHPAIKSALGQRYDFGTDAEGVSQVLNKQTGMGSPYQPQQEPPAQPAQKSAVPPSVKKALEAKQKPKLPAGATPAPSPVSVETPQPAAETPPPLTPAPTATPGSAQKLDPRDFNKIEAERVRIWNQYPPNLRKSILAAYDDALKAELQTQEKEKDRAKAMEIARMTAARAEKAAARSEKKEDKRDDRNLELDVQKLGNVMGKSNVKLLINEADTLLKKIKSYNGNVPGYGRLNGMVPVQATSEEAQQIRQAVQKIFNAELNDQYGAAVSAMELNNAKQAFGNGVFLPSERLVQGLEAYKRALDGQAAAWSAGFSPEVRQRYYENMAANVPGESSPDGERAPGKSNETTSQRLQRILDAKKGK